MGVRGGPNGGEGSAGARSGGERPEPTGRVATELLGIRRGEGRLAWLFFTYFMLLAVGHYSAKVVRQAVYLDVLGAEKLPYVYLLVALVSFPILVVYARLSERVRHAPVIACCCVVQTAVLAAFYFFLSSPARWVPLAFYVWTTVAFGLAVSQLWSYANHVFDPRQARRLFAFVGAGGLVGAIPGGQLARVISGTLGSRHTLVAAAAVSLLVVVVVVLIERSRPDSAAGGAEEPSGRLREARGGFQAVRESRLLVAIAGLMLLSVMVAQAVDLQFNWAMEKVTVGLDQRTAVFGSFFSVMGVAAVVFQILFTQRIHRVLGVGFGMRVLPGAVGVATLSLLLAAGLLPAVVLAVAWVLKLSEGGLRHSIDQATRELLFLPVPALVRRQAKAFIDVFVQRFGEGVAALALLPVTFGLIRAEHVSVLTVVLVAAWLWLTVVTKRRYVGAFREGLRSAGPDGPATLDAGDVATVTTLVEAMGSVDPREVLSSLDLLASHGRQRLIPPWLLHHPDATVRRRTLEVLADSGRSEVAPLVERLVGDEDPAVRSSAIVTLARLKGEDAQALMLGRLDDPDPRARAAAVAGLLAAHDRSVADRAAAVLAEMAADADSAVRAEAAGALGQVREPVGFDTLVQLLYDDRVEVVARAIAAVRSRLERDGPNSLYVPTLVSLLGNRRLKHEAREAVVAFGPSALESLLLFMSSRDEQLEVRRAVPKTIALLGGAPAVRALMSALPTCDEVLRNKVIAALAYLRRREGGYGLDPGAVRREIRREADTYLRGLADLWVVSTVHQLRLEGPFADWRSAGRVPGLLDRLLAERMSAAVTNVFALLELLLSPSDVRAAHCSLVSGQGILRARALEYLDNTLSGSLRRVVLEVIDDAPIEDKLRRAAQLLDLRLESVEETVTRLLSSEPNDDPQGIAPVVGAILAAVTGGLNVLRPVVEQLAAGSEDPVIRETAGWALARGWGAGGERGGLVSPVMTRVEMVVFLQGVDLFSFCTAEQVLQLAAISSECGFAAGEVVYRRNQSPDALYCVVEGRVELQGEDERQTLVGPQGRFGVLEILSGRLRVADAVATTATRALRVEAEDFFDLLSNNIEIVKALFRQVTRSSPAAGGGLL